MRRTVVAASIAAGVLATALVAGVTTASAAPGDPAFGWSAPEGNVHRDVAVSGSGRVFSVSLPEPGTEDHSWLEVGRWLEWSRVEVPPSSQGGVIAGPDDYAMAVSGNTSWVYDGTDWVGPTTIAADIRQPELVGNVDGDAALLWHAGTGVPYLSRLMRGGTWVTVPVTEVPGSVPRDVAINNAGKVTVVWALRRGTTSEIWRTVLQPGSTAWSPHVRIGTVNDPRPRLTLVTEGTTARETILAGNKLWRQPTGTRLPTYQFRTSVRAELAAADTLTRLVWAGLTGDEHRFYTRSAGTSWGSRVLMWSSEGPEECPESPFFGVGTVPSGRSYVAMAVRTDVGETTETCGGPFTALVTLDRFDGILNTSGGLDTALQTTPFQIVGGTGGPIVVEYEPGNWTVNWRMQFFDR